MNYFRGVGMFGSAFLGSNPTFPDGSQVAFLQGNGSMSQSVVLSPGSYQLYFSAAQRVNWQSHYQEIQVLVDGVQTTVLFHVAGVAAAIPFLTLSDDHGWLYQPRVSSVGGSGFAMLPRPMGWRGALWDLLRLVPFLGAGQPARGYTIFASLLLTVHTATVRIVSRGNVQAVRIPLHLAALRALDAMA